MGCSLRNLCISSAKFFTLWTPFWHW